MEMLQDKYKDSKIGRIPKDWDVIKLGETCEFHRGQPFAKSEIIQDGVRECIHYGQLFTIYSEIIEKVYSKTNADLIRASEYGDILMPSSDVTPIGLATASVINKKGVLIGGDVNIIRPIIKLNSTFLSYLINYEKKKIIRLITGTNVKHLYNRNIKTLLYVYPPLPEQQKIADILSTVDEQISTTDKIIEKSKELKKGLMQKLFSEGIGHTEFKDTKIGRIPKDWKVETLEFFGDGKQGLRRGPFGGALKKEIFVSDGYLVYEQQNAIYKDFNRGRYYVNEEKYNEMSAFQVKPNDLIVSCSGTIGRIAIVPKNSKPGIINQALLRIRLKNIIDRKFFYYLWFSKPVQNKVLDMTQGSTMKNIVGMSTLRKTKLILPPLPEQQKIAAILSEADAKIEKEQSQKAQLEALKKGLMQQLLTGKKRVTV
jgi:type I restriction enzyme, S subunit